MNVALSPETERRLAEAASCRGVAPEQFARELIEQGLPTAEPDRKSLEVLEKWEAENATNDLEEIARRETEGERFMQSLARSRIEMEGPDARKLWP